MAEFEHLTKEALEQVQGRLWEIESSLNGMAALFRSKEGMETSVFDTDDLYGIGNLLKTISEKLAVQTDILQCGFDSTAVTKVAVDLAIAKRAAKEFQKEEAALEDEAGDED